MTPTLETMGLTAFFGAEFVETVVYTPAGGRPRSIDAVVNREPIAAKPETPRGVAPRIEVTVRNDVTLGISSSEIDLGGDTVTLARRIGETAAARPVRRIVGQDAGAMTVELR